MPTTPPIRARHLFTPPLNLLAFGFGSGLMPIAPGTAGTLAAVPLLVWLASVEWWWYLGGVMVAFVAGIPICARAAATLDCHDHPGIVWDEMVGFAVVFIFVPLDWVRLGCGFVLFRAFDICKPWPIGTLDKKVHGGFGIMLDDGVAGVATGIILMMLAMLFT